MKHNQMQGRRQRVSSLRHVLLTLASASALSGCAGLALTTTNATSMPRSAYGANDLAYSAAASNAIESQPAPGSCHYRGHGIYAEPDRHCTPGALNPQVNQGTIHKTICVRGWTATVRPPESVTEPEKRAAMTAYGNHTSLRSVEYDHALPLALGGAPNDPRNMWPEPNYGGVPTDSYYHNPKDRLERFLSIEVCAGRMSLLHAQKAIATDWVSAYRQYGGAR